MLGKMDRCRLTSDNCLGRGLWWRGQHYPIDYNADWATRKGLPKIGACYSPAGHTFDIYQGIGKSITGEKMEFACAVLTGIIG